MSKFDIFIYIALVLCGLGLMAKALFVDDILFAILGVQSLIYAEVSSDE